MTGFPTTGPGSGAQIVQSRAADFDLVVCAGGDGTLNEAISGVLRSGVDRPLGYIPCGSTNDFAASLKLSTDVLQATQDILDGVPVDYDVGLFNGRYFCYVASFGAFTRVSYNTPQNLKNLLGHLAYVLGGIQELSQIRHIPMSLELDGVPLEGQFLFGAVSNSTYVGGAPTLDPKRVDLRDGKFEVTLIRMPKNMAEVAECVQALLNQSFDCTAITYRSVSNLVIRQAPDVDWTLDGERAEGADEIRIENRTRAIRLVHRREEP